MQINYPFILVKQKVHCLVTGHQIPTGELELKITVYIIHSLFHT